MAVRSEEEIEALFGQQFALESMLTHLIWQWGVRQDHPPTALANYFRPIEERMADMASSPEYATASMKAAQMTVRGVAEEIERTLKAEASRRAGD